jgi:triacylglycerol lipase
MKTQFAFNPTASEFDPINAYWLGCAARLAYLSEAEIRQQVRAWGMDRFEFISSTSEPPSRPADTQAFVMANRQAVIASFRGTEGKVLVDWVTDAGIVPAVGPGGVGTVHRGFSDALAAIYDQVKRVILEFSDAGQTLWFTGHSLGAALAVLTARSLHLDTARVPAGIYTFGQPRTGDATFASAFDEHLKPVCFRFINNNDIVPRLPPQAMGYSDMGTLRYFNAKGALEDDPSESQMRKDGIEGAIDARAEKGPDGFNDHGIGRYLANLERLLGGD